MVVFCFGFTNKHFGTRYHTSCGYFRLLLIAYFDLEGKNFRS